MSLLDAVGTTVEQPGGKLDVTIGSEKEFIEPPAGEGLDTQAVLDLRRMLGSAGYGPDGPGQPGSAADLLAHGGGGLVSRPMMPSAFPVSAIISRLARSSEIAARLISTLTRAWTRPPGAFGRGGHVADHVWLPITTSAPRGGRPSRPADDLGGGQAALARAWATAVARRPAPGRGPGPPAGVGHRQERPASALASLIAMFAAHPPRRSG